MKENQLYLNQKGTLCSNNLVEIEFESMRQNPYKTITQALKKLNIFDESYTKDLKKFLNASEIKEYKVLDYKTDTMLRVRLETSLRIGYKLWEEIKNPQGV